MSPGHATAEHLRLMASQQREAAWIEARELLAKGQIAQAADHMRAACRRAWEQYERPPKS